MNIFSLLCILFILIKSLKAKNENCSIAPEYYAPKPNGTYPPHVQRRLMRFCSNEQPDSSECKKHPELKKPGQIPGNSTDDITTLSSVSSLSSLSSVASDLSKAVAEIASKFNTSYVYKEPKMSKFKPINPLDGVPNELSKPVMNLTTDTFLSDKIVNRTAINETCLKPDSKCKEQSTDSLNRRANIAEMNAGALRKSNPGRAQYDIDNEVETICLRMYQLKKTLLKVFGLDQIVEPADNCCFQWDILLSIEQSEMSMALLNYSMSNSSSSTGTADSYPWSIVVPAEETTQQSNQTLRLKRQGRHVIEKRAGNSLYLEQSIAKKWNISQPISFVVDSTFTISIQSLILQALYEIQGNSCITFQQLGAPPTSGPFIQFTPSTDSSICGLSYIGMQTNTSNTIWLNPSCPNFKGVAQHECLHALGLQHEQIRFDRNQSIIVNWTNVNPAYQDSFATSDPSTYTSYGEVYDVGSIMHYGCYVASGNGQKTMTSIINPTVNDPKMGQRQGLSQTDIDMLNKMYCYSASCVDRNVYCGYWANNHYCTTGTSTQYMSGNCAKSCSFCW